MTKSPQNTEDVIPAPLRDLLTAISETLSLPSPAGTLEDFARYEADVCNRTHLIQLAIGDILSGKTNGVQWEADYLRRKTDAPPRYRTPEQWLADLKQTAAGNTGAQHGPAVTE